MKPIKSLLLLAATLPASSALAGTPAKVSAAAAPIETVVVFADRAQVIRSQSVACEKGAARATFAGLPASLDARTARGGVKGGGEAIGTTTEQINDTVALSDKAQALQVELQKLQDKQTELNDGRFLICGGVDVQQVVSSSDAAASWRQAIVYHD